MHIFLKALPAPVSEKPPNRTCKWCGRKMVAPEMMHNGWGFPSKKEVCDSCLSLEYDEFKSVNTNRKVLIKSDKEAEALLPLMMINDAQKTTKLYYDLDSLREDLKKFDEGYRKSNIRIIERQFKNLNDYFL